MPYVLKNKKTLEIYTCSLTNIYDFTYHGTKFWESRDKADKEYVVFLQAAGEEDSEAWDLIEVEEHQLKIFNVKLKNDPARKLFLDEQGNAAVRAGD